MIQFINPEAIVEARISRDQAAANLDFFTKVAVGLVTVGFIMFLVGDIPNEVSLGSMALGACAYVNSRANLWIYDRALKFGQQPYEHRLTLSKDIVDTKAQAKVVDAKESRDAVKAWTERTVNWCADNVGKCALRIDDLGYHFYFKKFEDYALFKLWV